MPRCGPDRRGPSLRILILNCDYPRFLDALYAENPGLSCETYANQLAIRNDSLFGVSDFYSRNFRAQGHEAWEIHVNNPYLQGAWARQHGLRVEQPATATRRQASNSRSLLSLAVRGFLGPVVRRILEPQLPAFEREVLLAQTAFYRPDVVLNQEMGYVRSPFLRRIRTRVPLIVGQIAAARPVGENYSVYDLVVSSLPNFVAWFRARGIPAEQNGLAFEPSVLDRLGPPPSRDIDVSFVGSLSPEHASRVRLLEYLAENAGLQVWGNGLDRLSTSSPLRRCYRGEAWGRRMYEILRRSRLTINHHIDLAEGHANNMRLYEATGMGTLMLVDRQRNIGELFAPEAHLVTYGSAEECADLTRTLLGDEKRRARIAADGQNHTLAVHTYAHRVSELIGLFAERLRKAPPRV